MNKKMSCLEEFCTSNPENYATVGSMIIHEKDAGICQTRSDNGCRTLLRLHRAMEFLIAFFEEIVCSECDTKLSTLAAASYDSTLSKHHSWFIRKGVQLAVHTLPTKAHLLQHIGNSEADTIENLQKSISVLKMVYISIENMYGENNLLQLP